MCLFFYIKLRKLGDLIQNGQIHLKKFYDFFRIQTILFFLQTYSNLLEGKKQNSKLIRMSNEGQKSAKLKKQIKTQQKCFHRQTKSSRKSSITVSYVINLFNAFQYYNSFKDTRMETQQLRGIQSSKFLDINSIQHRFPEILKGSNIPTTLLHNHSHCPTNYVLIYIDNFTKAIYKSRQEAQNKYYACSWYLENNEVIPYQFCDYKLDVDRGIIQKNLNYFQINDLKHYGTTLKPITNEMQYQTENGHIYLPINKVEQNLKYSETAFDGKNVCGCNKFCITFIGQHGPRVHS